MAKKYNAMDGPNVNWKVLQSVQEKREEDFDIGSCKSVEHCTQQHMLLIGQ